MGRMDREGKKAADELEQQFRSDEKGTVTQFHDLNVFLQGECVG